MKLSAKFPEHNWTRVASLGLLLLALAGAIWLMAQVLPDGIDWTKTYRPAALELLDFRNPYTANVASDAPFVAAPWGLIPLIPLAVLPLNIGRAMLFLVSIIAFGYTAQKLGASLAGIILFLISPPVMHCLLNANIEWIPILGFVLPPQIGLFFIAVKPQTGFAIGIFWLYQAWSEGGVSQVIKTFLPVTLALIASFILFGLWPLHSTQALSIAQTFNASLWPLSIPVGLALIVASIHFRQAKWSMAASPCLSPYVLFHSWSSALVALSSQTLELATVVVGLWLVVLLQLM